MCQTTTSQLTHIQNNLQVPLGPVAPEPVPEGAPVLNPQRGSGQSSRERRRMVGLRWRRSHEQRGTGTVS